MKVLSGAVVLFIALAGSACGSGHPATPPATTAKKAVVSAQAAALTKLPPSVRKAVEVDLRAGRHPSKYAKVNVIEVYGPATRTALDAAASGGGPVATPTERKDYYLTVLYGHFVCDACSRPPLAAAPRGAVETTVWSPTEVGGDFGLMGKLPRAVSQLHRLTRIRLR